MLINISDSSVPHNLRGPLLVDELGLPRYWAAVWATVFAAQLAEASFLKKLRYIENLYQFADRLLGPSALDDSLGRMNIDALGEILESWFISIRNQAKTTESDEKRWQTGFGFVSSVMTWNTKAQTGDSLRRIEKRLNSLSLLYRQFHVHRVKGVEGIRSLPADTIEALYSIIDPESSQNPFQRTRTKWRIYVSIILMLHQGLRRSETLLLPVDAVKSSYDSKQNRMRYWINVQNNPYEESKTDPRYSKPSIKTVSSIRQIPVSETSARIIEHYVQNYRGQPRHSYLLNSPSNKPLSTEALTKAFLEISKKMPVDALKVLFDRSGKRSITPHDLRHTCSVMRLHQLLQQGDSLDEAMQKLRTFFGWSKASTMPSRYARAVFEDRLATVWNDTFDDRVSLLRALPKGH